jgi:hypothetical protein
MDNYCGVDCPHLQKQSVEQANACSKEKVVTENVDGWLPSLPGGMLVN